jgi:hypothetical protein
LCQPGQRVDPYDQSALAAVLDDQGRVLLGWRHRFITGRWGWELPPRLGQLG